MADYIGYFSKSNNEFKAFLNFHIEEFTFNEETYPSVEHMYQKAKALFFGFKDVAEAVMCKTTGLEVIDF